MNKNKLKKDEIPQKANKRLNTILRNIREKRINKDVSLIQGQQKYSKTIGGKIGKGFQKTTSFIRNPTRSYYSSSTISPSTRNRLAQAQNLGYTSPHRTRRSGAGRPRGTVKYRDSNGNPIGVYEYRKLLSLRNFQQRQETLRRLAVNPQQQLVIDRFEAQRRATMVNPENQVIPDTNGKSPIGNFWGEIDDASNLFP